MAIRQVDYGSWLLRLLGWDGLLPVCVVLSPTAIGILIPNNPDAIEVTALAMPITAFVVRLSVGKRHIAKNKCSIAFRQFQLIVFCLGILTLLVIDVILILSYALPKGAFFATRTDWCIWGTLAAIYFLSMAIAMYPGAIEIVR